MAAIKLFGRVVRYTLAAICVAWLLWLVASLVPWIVWGLIGD